MIGRRLLLLIRDTFIRYPSEYGLEPGRWKASVKLLDETSHPRPIAEKALRNGPRGRNIQSQQRSA